MTVMAERYDRLRADGFTRAGAILHLARSLGIDRDTVSRVLVRADRRAEHDPSVSAPPKSSSRRSPRSDRPSSSSDPRRGRPNRHQQEEPSWD